MSVAPISARNPAIRQHPRTCASSACWVHLRAARPRLPRRFHRDLRRRREDRAEPRGDAADHAVRRPADLQQDPRRRPQADGSQARVHPRPVRVRPRRHDEARKGFAAPPRRKGEPGARGQAHLLEGARQVRRPAAARRLRRRGALPRGRGIHRCARHRGLRGLRPVRGQSDRERGCARRAQARQRRPAHPRRPRLHRRGRARRGWRQDRRARAERHARLPRPPGGNRRNARRGRRSPDRRPRTARRRRLPVRHWPHQGTVQARERQVPSFPARSKSI